jgi:ABC-type lipoprotein release transport system permease subunit
VAIVTAIDPHAENQMNQLDEKLTEGDFISANDNDILIARGLSEIFKLNVGDSLVLLGQGFQGATASGVYRIKGILDFPIPEMNNNLIFMSIGAAQWFFDLEERLTSLIIMPKNPKHATRVANQLNSQLDPEWYNVLTWEQLLEDELRFMKFDLVGTFIFMMILYIVIAFGLFGTVLTMMIERQREFGMLISLGMKRSRLAITCLMESIFISKTGVIIGLAIAIPIAIFFHHNPIPLVGEMDETFGQFGFEPVLPFSKDAAMFVKQALIVLGLSLLVGLYPVYKVLRLNIMKVKR